MKKIYIVLMMVFLSAGAFAQIKSEQTLNLRKPVSAGTVPYNNAARDFGPTGIYIDYAIADSILFGVSQSQFIWNMNEHYSEAGNDTNSWQTCIVRFDSLLYDLNTNSVINSNQVTNITVDSIYALLGQSNVSGNPDTLVTKILGLTAGHYPNVSNVLWSNTMAFDTSLSAGGNWLQTTYLQWNPALALAANVGGFAVQLQYYDESKLDTCGFLAAFNDQGACNTSSSSATEGNFYPNSYAAWTRYVGTYALLPDPTGIDIYYDCNQNGKFDAGDGWNYMQDIRIGAWITVTYDNVGVKEELQNTGMGLYQNSPNPVRNLTNIQYQLANDAKDVTLYVYDMIGNQVMQVLDGTKTSGNHTIQLDASKLAKGIYSYTLRADGSQLTKRMIVE